MRLLLAAAAAALAAPACAATLTLSVLQNPVPQSASDPCIICATTQAHQPTVDGALFGYNNFNSTGNDSSFNLFSSELTGTFGTGVQGTGYADGYLRDTTGITFGVAIDINSAATPNNGKTPETLDEFRLIDLTTNTVLFNIDGPIALPDVRNGNGMGDYLLSGFDLTGVADGDLLIFQAMWSHATDGGESFYLVPQLAAQTPLPAALPLFAAGLLGLAGLMRRRRSLRPA